VCFEAPSELRYFMASTKSSKRKKRGSSGSNSGNSVSTSPYEKKSKETPVFESTTDEVLLSSNSNMAAEVGPKLDQILDRLSSLEEKMTELDKKIISLDEGRAKETNDLKRAMKFLNNEVESVKTDLVRSCNETEEKCKKLEDKLLYYEVYQRRENLRFYGIEEDEGEDVELKVKRFLTNKLGIEGAEDIEFQRIHRVGQRRGESPRPIIARFLRYPDRENVFSRVRQLKGTNYSVSPDYPKEIANRRKKQLHRFLQARREGKRAYFSRPEPDKLYIDGTLFPL